MTIPNLPYDLIRRIEALEKRAPSAMPSIPGLQILGDGTPFFTGGLAVGGGGNAPLKETATIPQVSGLSASWGASFDVIYIDVTWTPPGGYGADQVASYLVQARKGSGVPIEIASGTDSPHTRIQPVEPNTTYSISVMSVNKNGRMSSPITTSVTTGADTTPPAAPSFPAGAVLAGIGSLAVKWNANTERDMANGAGQYRVVVSTSSNLSLPAQDVKVGGTFAYVGGLVAGSAYYVGVYAIDSSGNSSPLATPAGGPWTPLSAPTADLAMGFGGGNVVSNSSFESAMASWSLSGASNNYLVDAITYRYGAHSLGIQNSGDFWIYQDIVVPKGTWCVSVWAKASAVAPVSGVVSAKGVSLNAIVTAGSATSPVIVEGGVAGSSPTSLVMGMGTFDWTRAAMTLAVTSPSATIRVQCQRGSGGAVTGTAWFDGVQLEESDRPSAYAPKPDEILAGTITTTQIADNSITTPKLVAGSVVAGKIAAGAVGANEIQAHSITAAAIAASTITSTEIAAATITASNIAAGTITTAQIAANAITSVQIAANTITATDLAVTMGLIVGQQIESSNYVPNSAGWRIGGDGSAEFSNANIRNGAWLGGSINVGNILRVDINYPSIAIADNVEMGNDYSGTLYSGDTDWGLQVGTQYDTSHTPLRRWTHLQGYVGAATEEVGIYSNAYRQLLLYFEGSRMDGYIPSGFGRLFIERWDQGRGWDWSSLILANGGGYHPQNNTDQVSMSFWAPNGGNVANMIKLVGSAGDHFEFRNFNDTGFVELKALTFTYSSSRKTKQDIRGLGETSPLMALRPVRFRRPPTSRCAYCAGTGTVMVDHIIHPDEHGQSDDKTRVRRYIEKGDACPHDCEPGSHNTAPAQAKAHETDDLGLIAEEVDAVLPEVVRYDTELQPQGIDYSGVVALLVQHVQQQERRIGELEKR